MNLQRFIAAQPRNGLKCGPASGFRALMTAVFLCGLGLASSGAARGDVTYTYTGNALGADPPYSLSPFTTSDIVSGFFTLSTPLADDLAFTDITSLVTSFSFGDGLQTFTNSSTLTSEVFEVATDSTGAIDAWEVDLFTSTGGFLSCNGDLSDADACSPGNGWGIGGAADETFYPGAVGLNEADAGKWTATPEPSLLGLVGLGLLGMAVVVRRLRRA